MSQTHDEDGGESLQQERLRQDLRLRFPPEERYEVDQGTWIEIVDGRLESMPVTIVTGHGVNLTFFPRAPKNPPGPSRGTE